MSRDVPQSAARFERPLTLIFAAVAAAFAGLALLANAFVSLGMDQVWLLYAAGRVLSHAQIYGAEVMESNPPFIIWVSAIPAALSRALGQPAAFGFRICVVLLTVAILAWCLVLLRHLVAAKTALLGWAFTTGLMGLTFYLAKTSNAGEREHLMLLFMLPYLFGAALRLRDSDIPQLEAFAMGLSAAAAVCCKPQHLLVVMGVELLLAVHRRSLTSLVRPEFFGVVAGGFAYLGSVELFAPRYLHLVVPLLTQTYWAFGGIPLLKMVLQKRSLLLLVIALACAAVTWAMRRKIQSWPLLAALLTAATCSLAAYWAQGTGFNYQLIPVAGFLAMSVMVLLADVLTAPWKAVNHETTAPLPGSRAVWPPVPIDPLPKWAAPVLFVMVCCVVLLGMRGRVRASAEGMASATIDPKTKALLASYPAGTPVAWMELDPGFFPAVVQYNFVWGSRFPHLWMIPAIVRTETHQPNLKKHLTQQQLDALTATQDRFMVEDLQNWKPKLVGVERCGDPAFETCEGMKGAEFDVLPWFQRNAEFNQEWSHYKFLETAGRYDFYQRLD